MRPQDVAAHEPAPQRVLVTSRQELLQAVQLALQVSVATVRALHRDLAPFQLASHATTDALAALLAARRAARVRLLVDDATWLDTGAPRLRALQRRFPHALELRVAAPADPVGDDAWLLADDHSALEARVSRATSASLWLHHRAHAQPLLASFDRRWEAAGHNLPVVPLGLG